MYIYIPSLSPLPLSPNIICQVVSLDGTMISKSGNITGGLTGGMEAKSKRWDEQEMNNLREEKDKCESLIEKEEISRKELRNESEISTSLQGIYYHPEKP